MAAAANKAAASLHGKPAATVSTASATARVAREIASAQQNDDLSILVACRDRNVRYVRALIIGPPDTPYEFGFFEFDLKFPKDYPIKPPVVKCTTTNGGRCRFNPNIYAEGRVCLSILGTWRGEPGEEWSSAQGLESVLLSIQSLLSANPYENEPGFEHAKKEEPAASAYAAKVRHETLRISVLQRLEALLSINRDLRPSTKRRKTGAATYKTLESPPPEGDYSDDEKDGYDAEEASNQSDSGQDANVKAYDADAEVEAMESSEWDPFADLLKLRFLWYYDAYMRAIESWRGEQNDGKHFKRTEFELPLNSMEGHFQYRGLKSRMQVVRTKLEAECKEWPAEAACQVAEKTQLATSLGFQFKQLQHKWNKGSYEGSSMEISLPIPDNPFLWHLTLFGELSTNLDGGIFNINVYIPPDFPERQPRVILETPMNHHRVSSTGVLCYFPQKPDEISSHLEAIVVAIDDKNPTYDPRAMVNPDAFALYWGGEDKRKVYNRQLRRSAQESSEVL